MGRIYWAFVIAALLFVPPASPNTLQSFRLAVETLWSFVHPINRKAVASPNAQRHIFSISLSHARRHS